MGCVFFFSRQVINLIFLEVDRLLTIDFNDSFQKDNDLLCFRPRVLVNIQQLYDALNSIHEILCTHTSHCDELNHKSYF